MHLDLLIANIKEILKMEIIFPLVKTIANSLNVNEDQPKWKKKGLICVQTIKVCFIGGENRIFEELKRFKKRNII